MNSDLIRIIIEQAQAITEGREYNAADDPATRHFTDCEWLALDACLDAAREWRGGIEHWSPDPVREVAA